MIALSSRYATLSLVPVLLAALPVWYHQATRPVNDDCRDPGALLGASQLAGAAVVESALDSNKNLEVVESRRILRQVSVTTRIVRTLGPSKLYASPVSIGFASEAYLRRPELRWLELDDAKLPVHWSAIRSDSFFHIEAYLFVHGARPVRDLMRSGWDLALSQLWSGTRPATVILVSVIGPTGEALQMEDVAEAAIADAWHQLADVCGY